MRKTKRLLILSVLLIALTLSFSTAALASGEDVIPDDAVAIVEFYNYNTKDYNTQYYTADQLAGGTIFGNEYGSDPYVYVTSITLLDNLTVEITDLGNEVYIGWLNFCRNDVPWELDLGGYTLTFVMPDTVTGTPAIPAVCIYTYSKVDVMNGTIVANITGSGTYKELGNIYVSGATVFGLAKWAKEIEHTFSNVEITSTDQNAALTSCFTVMESPTSPDNVNASVKLENCVVDLKAETDLFCNDVVSGQTGASVVGGKAQIVSGSYTGLDLTGQSTVTEITTANGSKKLETNPEGVNNDTTVIVSTATTAMIVKDGSAYLYDTLQDAVNAVSSGGTIQLLKQPEEDKVVVPDDPQFSITAFGDESIDTSELNLVTEDGKKVTVDDSGRVEVVNIPATGITLDKTNVEVFRGETVTLTATVSPDNSTDTVTWSSDNTDVATVTGGVVTGVSQGTATITATAGNVSSTCTVTVDPTWTVKLDDAEYSVLKGESYKLPSAPTKPGYIFMGWRGADGTVYQPYDVVEISSDTSFKAVWANMPDVSPDTPDEPDDEPDTPAFPFYDVSTSAWYYSAVKYVYDNGIMDGVDTYVFAPNDTLTRAMVWTMLARMSGVDTTGGATWYAKAQEWVTAKGISDGENPNSAITREQLVTMLWRYAGSEAVTGSLTGFTDYASISDWAGQAMLWATVEGIIEGDENGALTPTATATRAQAAAIFMRFIEN